MPLKQSDIDALVELFARSDWDEMHLEIDGEEIFLSNDSRARSTAAHAAPAAVAAPVIAPAAAPAAHAAAPMAAAAPAAGARPASWVAIKAPNLGTFYKASAPNAAPYVTVGARVEPATEVCMIEVMKLFTTVRAGMTGIVREVTAQDGQMVEFDEPIMWIEPV